MTIFSATNLTTSMIHETTGAKMFLGCKFLKLVQKLATQNCEDNHPHTHVALKIVVANRPV